MFGAGGAARAIGVELALAGAASITVVNRDPSARRRCRRSPEPDARAPRSRWSNGRAPIACRQTTDIVINATSIGLFPHVDARLDLDVETLKPDMVVADVIPNPPRTRLIVDAEQRGCKVIDGLGMLVNQGVIGIKYWTGIDVDAAVMRNTIADLFGNQAPRHSE